ncbi:hypothetical protein [Xanthomonas vasicola]|uniref:Uncharacterized protein n=1 Tax=Xanthomonas vasicola TaxID=56459 RepID=A0ABD7SD76_XANVA|nr:hypothetical protein [Xanthomonas vasicola]AZR22896.1 hypothetical protein NX81_011845 [Xanthomonas vasicola]MDO6983723.1 hypothetical protein [Xanthomonas vasicola]TWQ28145.1 hypothetical protein FQJ97_11270 [Xanthomonas vasicola]TWQ42077.1 hypothetical protein FQJ96_00525 [Xanthomonas vasicola]TWQ49740.1 hypothetical protein FQJ94_22175 [Xanthomonas vasicola]
MIILTEQAGSPCPLAATLGAAGEYRAPGVQGWNPCGYGAWMRRLFPVRTRLLALSGPDITSNGDRFFCQLKWKELPVEIIHDNNCRTGVINYVD